ncbi:MFS transporter [Comamonas serinivorans]|uniref:MFS transporter n=1 Tax=Comamonas serinivorans TaxID=1082851 RepID=A0A1Y0EL85_9BURK|nr:tripartite tricarboxylate transporter substrate binding protein [Comamonas serinivorans]ARU04200.1 MFS transporter [Comamonas serinivorans]
MSLTRRQTLRSTALLGAGLAPSLLPGLLTPAHAQSGDFPNRAVRFIVPFPPGGPVDTTGRGMAVPLGEMWKQPTVIDNRAGAGGVVGAEMAAKQPADGYNLFVAAIHHAVMPSLRSKLPYDIENDFVAVSFAASFPVVLVAHPSVPAKNIAELIALDKKSPGTLTFGSSGNGGGTHLAGELFNMHAGTKLRHIPYKGSAPAMNDVLGGQVQLMFSDAPTAIPQLKGNRVRALGVASLTRSALFPGVPTVAEQGVAGYEAYSWAALFAPKGTPPDIVKKINADVNKALNQPAIKQRLFEAGAEAKPGTSQQMATFLRSEMTKWAQVVKAANIQMD